MLQEDRTKMCRSQQFGEKNYDQEVQSHQKKSDIAKEKLLFTKRHNTRKRGYLLKLVGVKFQKDTVLF